AAGAERGRRYVLRRPAATRADLTGEWETPVDGVFESGWLALKPDGTFRYEMHDVALGWKTTVSGTWRLEDRSVVLQEQGRLQDGLPAEAKARQVERLCPVYQYGGWSL